MGIIFDEKCRVCFLGRYIAYAKRLGGTQEQLDKYVSELNKMIDSAPKDISSAWFAPHVARLLHDIYGLDMDRFQQEKKESNRFVLERMDRIWEKVRHAPDPVFAGLQFAALGNYIDFSALADEVNYDKLDEMLQSALEMELDRAVYGDFCRDLENGKKLLYLTDNAGEIGFDRILAEELHKKYPHLQIVFCVRGGPANNDATREDAAVMGIPFPVIDNGNRVPGTQLDMLGQEAREAMETADVILAKGQGNAETLLDCGYNIYYVFLAKCIRFMERYQKPKLTPMFVKER